MSRRVTRGIVAAAGLLMLGTGGCGAGRHRTAGVTPIAPSPSVPPSVADGSLKPVIQGLVDKDSAPPPAYQSAVRAYVVNVNWSDLQPTAGGPIAADNALDQAIANVRRLHQQQPGLDIALKLRVYGGIFAPQWAKDLDGQAFPFQPLHGSATTLGRFWTADYGRAYEDLQNRLALAYDGVPELREVVVARCTADTDEPFRTNANIPQNGQRLLAAGYSVATQEACETAQLDESRAWQHTRLDLDLSPNLQTVNANGKSSKDDFSFTQRVLTYCRQTLGTQCVLENNSLEFPVKEASFPQLYAAMKQAGPPLAFQTIVNSGAKHGLTTQSLMDTLNYGVSLGASSIELHEGFESLVSPDQLNSLSLALAHNPT